MALSNKDIRRIFVSSVLLVLAIAAFLIIKPIMLSFIKEFTARFMQEIQRQL